MSLLPIIYTSLLIFAVVMTVVLLISYISYKAKQRNRIPDNSIHESIINHNASLIISRPTYASPQTVSVPVYSQPVRTQYTEQQRVSSSTRQIDRADQRRVSKEISSRKRFQVMNNSNRNDYITKFQPSNMGSFNSAPAPEFNFLNYYSDQKDDKLNHIVVDKYKNYR